MVDYRELFFRLFAAIADGVEAIEEMDYGRARKKLIEAMQDAEESVIAESEMNPTLTVYDD